MFNSYNNNPFTKIELNKYFGRFISLNAIPLKRAFPYYKRHSI
jgi:hypothetical protein